MNIKEQGGVTLDDSSMVGRVAFVYPQCILMSQVLEIEPFTPEKAKVWLKDIRGLQPQFVAALDLGEEVVQELKKGSVLLLQAITCLHELQEQKFRDAWAQFSGYINALDQKYKVEW